ncbi:hypothetical protein, partial [uncultured Microscilla sp.]|uniref:hypothetical protein n=1 Tax=uncultured Microscilla sp. TaxID=432653 RepID=UPI00260510D6
MNVNTISKQTTPDPDNPHGGSGVTSAADAHKRGGRKLFAWHFSTFHSSLNPNRNIALKNKKKRKRKIVRLSVFFLFFFFFSSVVV